MIILLYYLTIMNIQNTHSLLKGSSAMAGLNIELMKTIISSAMINYTPNGKQYK